jgi:hypothetical protein
MWIVIVIKPALDTGYGQYEYMFTTISYFVLSTMGAIIQPVLDTGPGQCTLRTNVVLDTGAKYLVLT